jgi:hypothetical protein
MTLCFMCIAYQLAYTKPADSVKPDMQAAIKILHTLFNVFDTNYMMHELILN